MTTRNFLDNFNLSKR